MATLPLTYKDRDPILREEAKSVDAAWLRSEVGQQLVEDMIETMYHERGVGLAAPQIGESIRLIIVDPGHGRAEVIANPELEILNEKEDVGEEGCLSIPGNWGRVPRAKKLRVTGLDRNGNDISFVVKGFHARVYQHEVDHLNGTLIVDRFLSDD
ncbi:MAG: peptide deformylase [Candidatus Andersenbacteria bacterium]|nr:peptide deformylase [Candidatus Andersenbacteria bacterium]